MTLHLTAAPFHWSVLKAGLFGLIGLAAGIVTPFTGRLIDRYGPLPVVGASSSCSWPRRWRPCSTDPTVIWLFGISTFLLTWANQSMQAANQNRSSSPTLTRPRRRTRSSWCSCPRRVLRSLHGAALPSASAGCAPSPRRAWSSPAVSLIAWPFARTAARRHGEAVASRA